jgi:hypothetical protein
LAAFGGHRRFGRRMAADHRQGAMSRGARGATAGAGGGRRRWPVRLALGGGGLGTAQAAGRRQADLDGRKAAEELLAELFDAAQVAVTQPLAMEVGRRHQTHAGSDRHLASSSARRGRIQVLNCWAGNSCSRQFRQCVQNAAHWGDDEASGTISGAGGCLTAERAPDISFLG